MLKNIQWNRNATTKQTIIWITVLGLLLSMGARRLYTPLTERLKISHAQSDAKRMELDIHRKLKNTKAPPAKGGSNEAGRVALSRKVNDAFSKGNMSPDVVESELLTSLTATQFSKAVLLEKLNFTGEKKQPGYSEMSVEMKIVGTYDGIANYLKAMRELPYLLKVDSVTLKPNDPKDLSRVELAAKGLLFVGDRNAPVSAMYSRSDTALDLLLEINRKKPSSPFLAKDRAESAWSLRELKLTSILSGGAHPSAQINGKIFERGESIAEFKIAEVRPQEVVLERGDVRYVLKLSDSFDDEASGGDNAPAERDTEETTLVEEKRGPDSPAEAESDDEAGEVTGSGEREDDVAPYRKNEYGILSQDKENAPEAPAAEPAEEVAPPEKNSPEEEIRTSKLNPNDVEDIEGVPFEDLEDPEETAFSRSALPVAGPFKA